MRVDFVKLSEKICGMSCRALVMIIFTTSASAQEDIIRPPILESGLYQMTVGIPTQDPNDEDVFESCCVRIDLDPVIELGCGPRDGTNQVISFQVDVIKTPGDDAEVRCYTVNSETQSDYSLNAYILPFPLKPNPPTVQ